MRWLIITFSVGGGCANELLVFKHGVKISCTDAITRLIATEDTGLISEVEGQNGNQRKVTAAGA